MENETKNCQNCKSGFTVTPDDFGFYEKMQVPPPTLCPDCRMQRRLAWRNDFNLYSRKCNLCNRDIVSIYSSDNPQVIYCNTCWWSDKWDPKSFARDFDFSKPFFEQFADLSKLVPAIALMNDNGIGSVNSEYTQNFSYGKNCYMTMVVWKSEDCMYLCYGAEAKSCVDCMGMFGSSENMYESIHVEKCYNCRNVYNSLALIDCIYCYDCSGCQDSFQCVGLRNKKFHFQNVEYSEEEYRKIVASYALDTWDGTEKARKEFESFLLTKPRKYASLKNCVTSTGDNLSNCKNSKYNFHLRRSENSKYIENGDTQKDSYDLSVGGELSECYEGLTPDHSSRALFTMYVWKSVDVLYSEFCQASQDCFGCVALKHGKYSILNKEYTKEEYLNFKEKIVEHMKNTGEWGEFFPMKNSPFAYNESMANLSFPMTKEKILATGLKYNDNPQQTRGKTTLKDIPQSIHDVPDSILQEVLECRECERNYKITQNELIFYKKQGIPVPRNCFFCRLANRFMLRTPSKLWNRECMNVGCKNEFETPYSPDRLEKIYCEACYTKEVY